MCFHRVSIIIVQLYNILHSSDCGCNSSGSITSSSRGGGDDSTIVESLRQQHTIQNVCAVSNRFRFAILLSLHNNLQFTMMANEHRVLRPMPIHNPNPQYQSTNPVD